MVRGTLADFCIFIILIHAVIGSFMALVNLMVACN